MPISPVLVAKYGASQLRTSSLPPCDVVCPPQALASSYAAARWVYSSGATRAGVTRRKPSPKSSPAAATSSASGACSTARNTAAKAAAANGRASCAASAAGQLPE